MKGVILAGGLGGRLYPLTKITNKHLLPVYAKPMIFYPIEMLIEAGVRDILIVTGGEDAGDFLRLIGNGRAFGLTHIDYTYQEGDAGIADALGLAEDFVENEKMVVVLGDNFLENGIRSWVDHFEQQERGARVFLKEVPNPSDYGVAEFQGDALARIEEKPTIPPSSFVTVGVFMYPPDVFDMIRDLKPAESGELEITDLNNKYIARDEMEYEFVDGWWVDAGDGPDALLRAGVQIKRAMQDL